MRRRHGRRGLGVKRILDRLPPRPGGKLLAAVSGGPDSTALLVAAVEEAPAHGLTVAAAYVDHGLRPEAAAEGEGVRALATRLGARFFLLGGDARELARQLHTSCQDGARVLRYRLLGEIAAAEGFAFVATGHTADDQAETFLLRLLRGAGLPGLGAILPERPLGPGVTLVRPMLHVRRAEALAFLEARGLASAVVSDPSNRDPHYARTRVRAELLPWLAGENASIVEQLGALAADARAASALLDGMGAARLDEYGAMPLPDGGLALPVAAVAGAPEAVRPFVLRAALARAGGEGRSLERPHVEAALRICADRRGSAETTWPGGWRLVRTYGRVEIRRSDRAGAEERATPPATADLLLEGPGTVELPWAVAPFAALTAGPAGAELPAPSGTTALLRAAWPLVVRARRPGDRVRLAGRRTRRLQDVLVDARVPRGERDRLPLVCAGPTGETILFVPGLGAVEGALAPPGIPAIRVQFAQIGVKQVSSEP